jgi:excisionase family DNA binding protein
VSQYLVAAEVAARLRLSVARVYALVDEGVLPARRVGARGRLLFIESEVEAVLRRAGRGAAAPAADPVPAA